LGNYLYLGFPTIAAFGASILFISILVASLGGIAGTLMGKAIIAANQYRSAIKNVYKQALFVLFCGVLFALVLYRFGTEAAGPGKETLNRYLFEADPSINYGSFVLRFIGPIITYSSGAAAGVFAPALSAGAAIGSFVAGIFHVKDHLHLLALCGMIGFLTGITRTPFTSFVLVLEMTDRHQAIFPMMFASMIAYGASHLIDSKSFYERVKESLIEKAEQEEMPTKAA
jgi:H+/Cl- antiporter ClcA